MTKFDAATLTGLSVREFPDGKVDFLRCQLGEWHPVTIKVSAYKSVPDKVFHLIAYGHTWDRAVENLERKTAAKQHA